MSVLTLPQGGLTDMPSQVVSDKLLVCDLKSPVLAASLSAIKLPATNPLRTKHQTHTLPSETLLSSGTDNEKSAVMLLNHVNDGAADHSLESNLEPVMLVSAESVDTKDQSTYSNVTVQANDETNVNSSDVLCETETTILGDRVTTVLPNASSVVPPVFKSAAPVVAVSNEHLSSVVATEQSQTVCNKRVQGPMVGRKSSQTVISNSVDGMGSLVLTVAPSNLAVTQQITPVSSTSEAKTKSDKKLKRSSNSSGQWGELEQHNNGVVSRQGQPSHLAASNNVTVIREVYENGSAMEYFAMQLDFALDSGVNTIIIEPSRLGRETTHWLRIGCFLRRMAVVSGSASIIAGAFGQDSACLPLGTLAGIASTIYIASWRPDPCALYRVEHNVQQLQRLPLPEVSCTQPVVLVRCNRMRLKNGLHDSVSAAALAVCLWRLYRWYNN